MSQPCIDAVNSYNYLAVGCVSSNFPVYFSLLFQRLHNAVREGDIDEVEQLLDEPGASINSVYVSYTLC